MRVGFSYGSSSGFSAHVSHGNNRGFGPWHDPHPPRPPAGYFEQPSSGLKIFTPGATPAPKTTPPVDTAAVANKLGSDIFSPACSATFNSTWGNANEARFQDLIANCKYLEAFAYTREHFNKDSTEQISNWLDTLVDKGESKKTLTEKREAFIETFTSSGEQEYVRESYLKLDTAWSKAIVEHYDAVIAADRRPEAYAYMEEHQRRGNVNAVDDDGLLGSFQREKAIILPYYNWSSGSSSTGSNPESSSSSSSPDNTDSSSSELSRLASEHSALLFSKASSSQPPIHPDCVVSEKTKSDAKLGRMAVGIVISAAKDEFDYLSLAQSYLNAIATTEKEATEHQISCTLAKVEQALVDKVIEATDITKDIEKIENTRKRSRSPSPRPQ